MLNKTLHNIPLATWLHTHKLPYSYMLEFTAHLPPTTGVFSLFLQLYSSQFLSFFFPCGGGPMVMVVWWRLGSVLYRIMSRKKTGQLKVLVYKGWTLSMEIISSIILRCDFSSMKLPIKIYMCTHLKTVICFHQPVPSSLLKVNYLAIFFVYNFCLFILYSL